MHTESAGQDEFFVKAETSGADYLPSCMDVASVLRGCDSKGVESKPLTKRFFPWEEQRGFERIYNYI